MVLRSSRTYSHWSTLVGFCIWSRVEPDGLALLRLRPCHMYLFLRDIRRVFFFHLLFYFCYCFLSLISNSPYACMLNCFSHVLLCVTLWITARQSPLSMGFSRQGYWSGLPCPPPGDFPDPGIEPKSLMSPVLAGRFFTTSATWRTPVVES